MTKDNLEDGVCVKITILYDAKKLSLQEILRDVEEITRSGTEYGKVISSVLEYKVGYYINLKWNHFIQTKANTKMEGRKL